MSSKENVNRNAATKGTEVFGESHKTLYDLTGKESGIVLFPQTKSIIICNWATVQGIPRMDPTGYMPMGLGEDIYLLGTSCVGCVWEYLRQRYDELDLLYTHTDADDLENLHGGPGTVSEVTPYEGSDEVCIVIAPFAWA